MSRAHAALTLAVTLASVVAGSAPEAALAQRTGDLPLARTALTLPAGHSEIGVVAPLRYGLDGGTELELRPLAMLVAPNVALKHRWHEAGALVLSSRHAVLYPSGLYALLAREGVGGILPYETRVPFILSTTHTLLLSYLASERAVVTLRLGTTLAARFGRELMTSIDLPWIYVRQAPHRRGWSVEAGADLELGLGEGLALSLGLDLYRLGTKRGQLGLEQRTSLTWRASERVRVALGYLLVYQQYPYGADWNLGGNVWPLPTADVLWRF